jgi:hypothetical protein
MEVSVVPFFGVCLSKFSLFEMKPCWTLLLLAFHSGARVSSNDYRIPEEF